MQTDMPTSPRSSLSRTARHNRPAWVQKPMPEVERKKSIAQEANAMAQKRRRESTSAKVQQEAMEQMATANSQKKPGQLLGK